MANKQMTQTRTSRRSGSARWLRLLCAAFTLALIASACGSDSVADVAQRASDAVDETTSDADLSSVFSDDAMEDDEAMEDDSDDAMEDSGESTPATRAPTPQAADVANAQTTNGGGLFGTVDVDEEVNALTRDVDTDEFDSFADMVDMAARLS